MNAEKLIELYDRVAEAPDAIPRLRRFVLDLAVRGKLVEQDPGDEPASALLNLVASERRKCGLKHADEALPDDDAPFDLPRGWTWTQLGALCTKTGSGSTPRGGREVYRDVGVPFLRSQNVHDDGVRLDDVAFIDPQTHARMTGTRVLPGDLLLNITGGSIGRCALVPDDLGDANVSQHVAIIRPAILGLRTFLHGAIRSPYFQGQILKEQTGAGRGGLPKNRMDRIAIALPPLAEQHRIVARVDELMALLDRLEAARSAREATRDRFTAASLTRLTTPAPDTRAADTQSTLDALPALTARADQIKGLRESILDLAIRGKLVEQDPLDESASTAVHRYVAERQSTGAISRSRARNDAATASPENQAITPIGWIWSTLGEVGDWGSGSTPSRAGSDYYGGEYTWLKSGELGDSMFLSDSEETVTEKALRECSFRRNRKGDVLIAMYGATIGKLAILSKPAVTNQAVCGCTPHPFLLNRFLFLFLLSNRRSFQASSEGGAQPNISKVKIVNTPIPLPPLAEQHRIVAKVDELMALCDRLEAALTTADTTRARLLEALLHEALSPGQMRAGA